jgi:hypothetical protein
MRREGSAHGITSNGTIRYGGRDVTTVRNGGYSLYTTRNRIKVYNEESEIKGGKAKKCLKCGGSRYSCHGLLHEMNQFAKGFYRKEKRERDVNYLC